MLMLQLLSREAFDSMDSPSNATIESGIILQVAMGPTCSMHFLSIYRTAGPKVSYKPGSLFSVKYCV